MNEKDIKDTIDALSTIVKEQLIGQKLKAINGSYQNETIKHIELQFEHHNLRFDFRGEKIGVEIR